MRTTLHRDEHRSSAAILWVALRAGVLFTILCGVIYPLVSTGLAQMLFPHQADGSLLRDRQGNVIGSELIGQSFTDPGYFHGRVSSIAYNAAASGSNNYAPSNPELAARVQASLDEWRINNPEVPIDRLPIALVTNSGSGLDPHITPQSALVQIPRISKHTGLSPADLEQLVNRHTEARDLGLFGDRRVNVLKLNLALQSFQTSQ